MKEKSIYYDNATLLSYNRILSFVVGNRGGGKTFNATDWAIRDFLKNGKQFLYVRRYKTEFDKINQFFTHIKWKYPDVDFEVKGKKFLINGQVAGFAIALSTSQKEKSTAFPDVNKIIFDEFIITNNTYHYLQNEVEVFLDLYETVARMRNVRALFIANAITMVNPYFVYFGIKFPKGSKFVKGSGWAAELYKNEEFVEKKKQTQFGQLIDKTPYGGYNIDNEFLRDNDQFIEKLTGKAIYWCTILYMGEYYGVWFQPAKGTVYINKNADQEHRLVFCFTTEDHQPNVLLIKGIKNLTMIKRLKDAYTMSLARFSDLQTKTAFYEYMKLL